MYELYNIVTVDSTYFDNTWKRCNAINEEAVIIEVMGTFEQVSAYGNFRSRIKTYKMAYRVKLLSNDAKFMVFEDEIRYLISKGHKRWAE